VEGFPLFAEPLEQVIVPEGRSTAVYAKLCSACHISYHHLMQKFAIASVREVKSLPWPSRSNGLVHGCYCRSLQEMKAEKILVWRSLPASTGFSNVRYQFATGRTEPHIGDFLIENGQPRTKLECNPFFGSSNILLFSGWYFDVIVIARTNKACHSKEAARRGSVISLALPLPLVDSFASQCMLRRNGDDRDQRRST
jgi:hypothetical protein